MASSQTPWWVKSAARTMQMHSGPINSSVAGRTDHIPLTVASGSYVVPADIVSGLGEGNTAAGHQVIHNMFHAAPYGAPLKSIAGKKPPQPKLSFPAAPKTPKPAKFATGGPVDIMAAGGEHVLTPDQVMHVGGGDIDHGHAVLDAWVKHERKKINKTQAKLPGPARD